MKDREILKKAYEMLSRESRVYINNMYTEHNIIKKCVALFAATSMLVLSKGVLNAVRASSGTEAVMWFTVYAAMTLLSVLLLIREFGTSRIYENDQRAIFGYNVYDRQNEVRNFDEIFIKSVFDIELVETIVKSYLRQQVKEIATMVLGILMLIVFMVLGLYSTSYPNQYSLLIITFSVNFIYLIIANSYSLYRAVRELLHPNVYGAVLSYAKKNN